MNFMKEIYDIQTLENRNKNKGRRMKKKWVEKVVEKKEKEWKRIGETEKKPKEETKQWYLSGS